ncbi:hypothetical protein Pfo_010599 [Paulownia fortunei]|nr:hypothetical protein Pfo_010599 [Paulownia fortunei]
MVRVKNFYASIIISFLALLFLPQLLFWYFYPVILLSSLYSNYISILFKSFVLSLQVILSMTSGFNIYITATNTDDEANTELHLESNQQLEGPNLEEDIAQV